MSYQQIEKSNSRYTANNVQLLTVHASSVGGRRDISLYNAYSEARDIPIVFLLHGVYGNHWVWMHLGGVHEVYERLRKESGLSEMLLVMPSDGGFYGGSAYLPLKEGGDYDAWIVDDALNAVIETIECVSSESRVYISGLSMGGYGALRLGAKYPETFNGVSGHSSITSLSEMPIFVKEPLSLYECDNENESSIVYWMEKHRTQLPPMRFDCGKDDELYEGNIAFQKQLVDLGFSHEFSVHEGAHSWDYWNEHVATTLTFFDSLECDAQKK